MSASQPITHLKENLIFLSVLQVDLTPKGSEIMKNFLYSVCGFSGNYNLQDRQTKCINYIKEAVGDRTVLVCPFRIRCHLNLPELSVI